jgi:AFG3 family protein
MSENNFRKDTNDSTKRNNKPQGNQNNLYWVYGLILLFILFSIILLDSNKGEEEITQQRFWNELVKNNYVDHIVIVNEKNVEVYLTREALADEKYKKHNQTRVFGGNNHAFVFKISQNDRFFYEKLDKFGITFKNEERADYLKDLPTYIFLIGAIVLIWVFFVRRLGGGMGGSQIFNIGKSKASLFDKENRVKVTFSDVAGLEEAKQEVVEVVEFLKNPQKFTRLGGRIPKGVLLVGPPGTGKTLLAKAVAGEAQVPFFSLSGSDFVEMFVGVGAARVRDLFKQAKEKAPCIIFIDEIDAIGRTRGRNNFTGGNDERENTLNQLLVEMDGFNTDSGVILMAATNRPDILDSALLRPGRFDRVITVDRPDLKEREAIYNVHIQKLVKAGAVDVHTLAAQTPGFVGADIMNVCNEAALIAARKNKNAVDMEDFNDAIDRVTSGIEKKNKIISPEEKKLIAYHEAGHAVAGWFLEHADPIVKISIIPRGNAGGYVSFLPKETMLYNTEQLTDKVCVSLGGRAAEDIVFGTISTGAVSDLDYVTKIAYSMVTLYGMNPNVGNISFNDKEEMHITKPYSEALAEIIDKEVYSYVQKAYERVKNLLKEHKEALEKLAQALLEKEVLYNTEIEKLIGPRPYPNWSANIVHSFMPSSR